MINVPIDRGEVIETGVELFQILLLLILLADPEFFNGVVDNFILLKLLRRHRSNPRLFHLLPTRNFSTGINP